MIKKICNKNLYWLIVLLLIHSNSGLAQQSTLLTIDSCFEKARSNFPVIKQFALIEKSREFSIANVQKAYLPQFIVAGQATSQSDVTQVPISIPNLDIPTISKNQYRLYGEVTQPITDLFMVKDNKALTEANTDVEVQKAEVELYKLKERISNLYFGILVIEAQIKQTELLKKDLHNGIDKTNVAIENGVSLKSAADNLKAELLKAEQRTIELKATRKGYVVMLSLFINIPIDEKTIFEKPERIVVANTINRPELKLYDLQRKTFLLQNKLINARNRPHFSLFLQGGFGKPGLNMLNSDLQSYYIGGLRLNWNISGFYTLKNEKRMIESSRSMLDIQRETFLFITNLTLKQQNADISKMHDLIETDKDIITLRENVKNTTQNQLKYGTATTNDYLIAVNAEDQAKQNLILHEIQLLMTEYNTQITTGNQ